MNYNRDRIPVNNIRDTSQDPKTLKEKLKAAQESVRPGRRHSHSYHAALEDMQMFPRQCWLIVIDNQSVFYRWNEETDGLERWNVLTWVEDSGAGLDSEKWFRVSNLQPATSPPPPPMIPEPEISDQDLERMLAFKGGDNYTKAILEVIAWRKVFREELAIESDTGRPEELRYHVKRLVEELSKRERLLNKNKGVAQEIRNLSAAFATFRDYMHENPLSVSG